MSDELRKYTTFYIIILVVMIGISLAVDIMLSADLPNSTGFIASAVAAILAGQSFAKRTQTIPTANQSWRLAFTSFLVVILITLAMTAATIIAVDAALGESLLDGVAAIPVWVYAAGIVFFGALHILAVRFLYPFGAKSALRANTK